MKSYLRWVLRHRVTIIVLTMMVTALALFQAKNLRLVIDMNASMPQSHPFISTTNQVEKVFGSKYIVVVGISPREGDVFQPAVLERVQRITTALSRTEGVVAANMASLSATRAKNIIGNAEGFEVRKLMSAVPTTPTQLASLRQAVQKNPIYLGAIVSHDLRTTSIIAEFSEPPKGFRAIMSQVDAIIAPERDSSMDIHVSGIPSYLAEIERYSERMGVLLPVAIVILALVLYVAFKTRQGMVLPLVTALIAVIWGVGVMGASGIPMDVFNATTPILILAVATGHAVQLLKRYYEEFAHLRATSSLTPHEANTEAIISSVSKVGPVMIAAGVVAALGFFSLLIFDISTVRTFGLFTGIGIVAALILELTFIPALRGILAPPVDKGLAREGGSAWNTFAGMMARAVTVHRKALLLTFAAFIGVSLWGMTRVVDDNSVRTFFGASEPVSLDERWFNERLGGTNTLYVLIEGKTADAIKRPRTLKAMDELQAFLEKEPNVSKTTSMAYFIKRMNQVMNGDDPAQFRIPDNQDLISQYLMLYSMSGDPGDFNAFVDYDYKQANLTVYMKTDSSAYVQQLAQRIQAFSKTRLDDDVQVRVGGSAAQSTALGEVMVRGKIMNIVQTGGVVFVVSCLVFRSLVGGLLVLLPLLIAVVVNFGLMGWSGILLNVPTSLTSAMAVGIGADYAIYMIYRLREELSAGLEPDLAVRRVMGTAGKAVMFVATAVAAGYGVLWLSFGFNIHQWLAILIGMAMLVSALSAVLLVPAIILTFRPSFIFGQNAMKLNASVPASVAMFALLLGASLLPSSVWAAELDVQKLMERNYFVGHVKDSSFEATFTLTNSAGQQRVRKTIGYTKLKPGGTERMRMTRFVSPPDVKGTASLLVEEAEQDDNIWIYLPALKKVRRLVASNKRDSFLGTDFSYADVIGHPVKDWSFKLVREEALNGQTCYVVEGKPRSDEVKAETGYSKRVEWIGKDNAVTLKSEFWDEAGQPLKTAQFKEVRQVHAATDKWQPMLLEVLNTQTGHRTTIQFSNFAVNQQIKDELFTPRNMETE